MKNKYIQSTHIKLNLDRIYKTDFITKTGDKVYNIKINEDITFSLNSSDISFKNMDFRIKLFKADNKSDRDYIIFEKSLGEKRVITSQQLINLLLDNEYQIVKKSFNWFTLTDEEKVSILTK